jgi:hypothetical protein
VTEEASQIGVATNAESESGRCGPSNRTFTPKGRDVRARAIAGKLPKHVAINYQESQARKSTALL